MHENETDDAYKGSVMLLFVKGNRTPVFCQNVVFIGAFIFFCVCVRSDALQAGASQFEASAGKLKRKYWWKNCKVGIVL